MFLKGVLANSEVARMQGQLTSRTNLYQRVLGNQHKLEEIRHNLTALSQLSSNRFLNATLLNALQQTTVNDLQLIRLRADQTYTLVEASKAHTNEDRVLPAKPATETEKILVTLEGNDFSRNAGDQVNRFRQTLATNPYFKETLAKTNAVSLKTMSAPQVSQVTGKPYVLFTLECRYPEKTR